MINERISKAITAFTAYARNHADITGWDIDHQPTPAEEEERRSAIETICDEMDALSQNADSRLSDFEKLRHKYDFFPPAPPEFLHAVAEAFLAAGR
jgi:hypothetical protein